MVALYPLFISKVQKVLPHPVSLVFVELEVAVPVKGVRSVG